jgi:hypothetical protein
MQSTFYIKYVVSRGKREKNAPFLPLAHFSGFREKEIIERKAKNVAFIEGT